MARSKTRSASPKRGHRPQVAELTTGEDDRPLVVNPLVSTDRLHNPDDIEVDTAAIAAGVVHGGMIENRAQELSRRGAGGRKRSGPRSPSRPGRDRTKKR